MVHPTAIIASAIDLSFPRPDGGEARGRGPATIPVSPGCNLPPIRALKAHQGLMRFALILPAK